jgi:hypothetical protein
MQKSNRDLFGEELAAEIDRIRAETALTSLRETLGEVFKWALEHPGVGFERLWDAIQDTLKELAPDTMEYKDRHD